MPKSQNIIRMVDLFKVYQPKNRDTNITDRGTTVIAAFLRKHGVIVDGKHKLVVRRKNQLGLHILGKIDFLSKKGFIVLVR